MVDLHKVIKDMHTMVADRDVALHKYAAEYSRLHALFTEAELDLPEELNEFCEEFEIGYGPIDCHSITLEGIICGWTSNDDEPFEHLIAWDAWERWLAS